MIRISTIVILTIVLLIASPRENAFAQPGFKPQPVTQNDSLETIVERGCEFLARTQLDDGGWPISNALDPRPSLTPRKTTATGDPAITSLAVMALLSSGHVPGEGKYANTLNNGIRFILRSQHQTGLFPGPNYIRCDMYYHGICTLCLAEVVGMTELKLAEELRQKLQLAVKVILQAQRQGSPNVQPDTGGWRYGVNDPDADLSVAGWQIMALRAAKNVGCDVPAERIQSALEYVKRCHDAKSGGFRYTVFGPITDACTGVGILCLELGGKEYHRSPEALKAGDYLVKNDIRLQTLFYGTYYGSQAMFQLGGDHWKSYRRKMHDLLIKTLSPNAEGAWGQRPSDRLIGDERYGPAYSTSMALLALTVEYRYLPIYQRFDEPIERPDD